MCSWCAPSLAHPMGSPPAPQCLPEVPFPCVGCDQQPPAHPSFLESLVLALSFPCCPGPEEGEHDLLVSVFSCFLLQITTTTAQVVMLGKTPQNQLDILSFQLFYRAAPNPLVALINSNNFDFKGHQRLQMNSIKTCKSHIMSVAFTHVLFDSRYFLIERGIKNTYEI